MRALPPGSDEVVALAVTEELSTEVARKSINRQLTKFCHEQERDIKEQWTRIYCEAKKGTSECSGRDFFKKEERILTIQWTGFNYESRKGTSKCSKWNFIMKCKEGTSKCNGLETTGEKMLLQKIGRVAFCYRCKALTDFFTIY
ncbi:uncharacterized protein LOC123545042 isoform X2 [Mercenaria mercenaria]|uniref:uncharacterized protein LOC123545042 isoform X2 n=1 Tax=Mercenaria mercenaria TaxID=6596 RepID=UPI00234E578A|nr:uncharacterized protein LOC123545042 isoform X2 [Mercenaria mercenaria]